MIEQPKGWVTITVAEIATTSSGGTPSRNHSGYYGGNISWVKSGELGDGLVYESSETITEAGLANSSAKMFPKGTLCIALYGATVGKLGILGINAATNQAVCGIMLPESIETRYVYRFLESHRKSIIDLAKGGAQPNISQDIVRNLRMPLAPLNEQRRIVTKLEELISDLEAATAAIERVQVNLKRYRASVLKSAVEGKLTAEWREKNLPKETGSQLLERILKERRTKWEENQLAKSKAQGKEPPKDWQKRYPEPAKADTNDLPKLPEGWVWASLDQLCSAARPICYGILMPKANLPNGVPYVRVKDMRGDTIDLQGLHRTSKAIADEYARASLEAGDILLAIRGTYGRVAVVPPELTGGNITQDTARLAVSHEISQDYVATVLRNVISQNFFKRVARGVAVKGVNIADVKLTPVPLPPLVEQTKILKLAEGINDSLTHAMKTIEEKRASSKALRQSILKQAFEGKLVPQDPNDEPASELLNRIREERESAPANKAINTEKKQRKPKTKSVRSVKKAKSITSRKRA